MKDEAVVGEWMRRAADLAVQAAQRDEVPVGAVIVLDGEVIAEGFNNRETTHHTTAHAEIVALESFNRRYQTWRLPPGAALYVTVEPCLMCTGALLSARLESLFFGCADTKNAGYLRLAPWIESGVFDHRFKQVVGGLENERCRSLISDYFRRKRQAANKGIS